MSTVLTLIVDDELWIVERLYPSSFTDRRRREESAAAQKFEASFEENFVFCPIALLDRYNYTLSQRVKRFVRGARDEVVAHYSNQGYSNPYCVHDSQITLHTNFLVTSIPSADTTHPGGENAKHRTVEYLARRRSERTTATPAPRLCPVTQRAKSG